MAINKVINSAAKSHDAMSNVIAYVLRSDKVTEGFVDVTGPYSPDEINRDGVYRSFLKEKKQWGKDSGRMYSHNVISFHKNERITPAQCLEIGRKFVNRFFGGFQSLLGIHQDKDHLHCHIVTNTVSFIDGHKLHQTRHDLEKQKTYTNELCRDRGFSVAEKGRHFDGSRIEEGQITAWRKDKYNLLANESKKSYLADCAIAIMEAVPGSASREEFVQKMAERGWDVKWSDRRKHIVFQDKDGHKVRDSNIEKTFAMAAGKEALNLEFERQAEQRRAEARELDRYYADVESAISRADAAIKGTGTVSGAYCCEGQPGEGEAENSRTGQDDFEALIAELDADIQNAGAAVDDSRAQNRDFRSAGYKPVAPERQSGSHTRERKHPVRPRGRESERIRRSEGRDIPPSFADR